MRKYLSILPYVKGWLPSDWRNIKSNQFLRGRVRQAIRAFWFTRPVYFLRYNSALGAPVRQTPLDKNENIERIERKWYTHADVFIYDKAPKEIFALKIFPGAVGALGSAWGVCSLLRWTIWVGSVIRQIMSLHCWTDAFTFENNRRNNEFLWWEAGYVIFMRI